MQMQLRRMSRAQAMRALQAEKAFLYKHVAVLVPPSSHLMSSMAIETTAISIAVGGFQVGIKSEIRVQHSTKPILGSL